MPFSVKDGSSETEKIVIHWIQINDVFFLIFFVDFDVTSFYLYILLPPIYNCFMSVTACFLLC